MNEAVNKSNTLQLPAHYSMLARLFDYPDERYREYALRIREYLAADYPAAVEALDKFIEALPENNLLTMQELYTRTFDVQAVVTLDVGYVLFGDDYKRGEMLANLSREHRDAGNDCGTELADHLPNLLRLMDRLHDKELRSDLAYAIIGPAVLEMIGEFTLGRLQQKSKANMKQYKTVIDLPPVQENRFALYKHALGALYEVLKQDFTLIQSIPLARSNDFLESVSRENAIEENAKAFG